MAIRPKLETSDTTFIELIDALSKPDAGWKTLSELEKRQRLDLLTYEQRMAFQRFFSPMLRLVPQLASLAYSLETQDAEALQAQWEDITKPVTRSRDPFKEPLPPANSSEGIGA